MEIKRVKEESYESIKAYLDEMMSIVPRYSDLCFVDHDGKRYMVGIGDEKFAIVENDNGELNPCSIAYPNQFMEKYETEEYKYDIITQLDLLEVVRHSRICKDCERLSYLPRIENHPHGVIEYVQFIDELTASVIKKYDVTGRISIDDSFNFSKYHEPDIIRVESLKRFLFWLYRKSYDYSLGLLDDFYYQPLIRLGDLYIGSKKVKYPSSDFMDELSAEGFNRQIPDDLSSLITGKNERHETLKLVVDNYQNYIKEQ